MMQNLLDKLGDWNPQLMRELKGRIQPRNLLLAVTISLVGQFLLLMGFLAYLPTTPEPGHTIFNISNRYCTGKIEYGEPQCFLDNYNNIIINWQSWSLDLFIWVSIICIFALLVMGTYLLINDLATEERRDTLNFLRLTPQTPQTILLGKMMGVPILLYLAVVLVIPLHLWSGLAANIPFPLILSFYGVLFTACICYYSAGLLFALVGSWLGGFQAWLGSGAVLGFLSFSLSVLPLVRGDFSLSYLRFINPFFLIPYLENSPMFRYRETWQKFHLFSFQLGTNNLALVIFAILNFAIINYFIWQGLQRCFRQPQGTMLSKQQSYLFMSYFAIVTVGCTYTDNIAENIFYLLFLNFCAFLYLIAAITPHRQSLIDWARYRHLDLRKGWWDSYLIKDLISQDKSPAILALAINAIIAIAAIAKVVISANKNFTDTVNAFIALGLAFSLAILYVIIVQISLFMKTRHRAIASILILGAVMILPLIVVGVLFHDPSKYTFLWLFSSLAPLFALSPLSGISGVMEVGLVAMICHLAIATFLMFQFIGSLQTVGESNTFNSTVTRGKS